MRDAIASCTWRPYILKITAYVDGASRGNPGPAGFGVYMTKDDGQVIEVSGYLGPTTNNVAEYSGLLDALAVAAEEGATELEVISDSLLLVQQMLGTYRVKHPNLIPLYGKAKQMASKFRRFSIRHTPRNGNKDADRLANVAVDRAEGRCWNGVRGDLLPPDQIRANLELGAEDRRPAIAEPPSVRVASSPSQKQFRQAVEPAINAGV